AEPDPSAVDLVGVGDGTPVSALAGDHDRAHPRRSPFRPAPGASPAVPLPGVAAPWCRPARVDVPGALSEGIEAAHTGRVDGLDRPLAVAGADHPGLARRLRRRLGVGTGRNQ